MEKAETEEEKKKKKRKEEKRRRVFLSLSSLSSFKRKKLIHGLCDSG